MVERRRLSVHRATVATVARAIQRRLRIACIIAQWRDECTVQGYGTGLVAPDTAPSGSNVQSCRTWPSRVLPLNTIERDFIAAPCLASSDTTTGPQRRGNVRVSANVAGSTFGSELRGIKGGKLKFEGV